MRRVAYVQQVPPRAGRPDSSASQYSSDQVFCELSHLVSELQRQRMLAGNSVLEGDASMAAAILVVMKPAGRGQISLRKPSAKGAAKAQLKAFMASAPATGCSRAGSVECPVGFRKGSAKSAKCSGKAFDEGSSKESRGYRRRREASVIVATSDVVARQLRSGSGMVDRAAR